MSGVGGSAHTVATRRSAERGTPGFAKKIDLGRLKLCIKGSELYVAQGDAALPTRTRHRAPVWIGRAAGIGKLPGGDQRRAGLSAPLLALGLGIQTLRYSPFRQTRSPLPSVSLPILLKRQGSITSLALEEPVLAGC